MSFHSDSPSADNLPKRPTRRFFKGPDKAAKDAKIADLRQKIKEVDYKLSKVSGNLDTLKVDEKIVQRRSELQNQLNEIIKVQGDLRNQRSQINDKVKAIDVGLKKKITDLNAKTSKSRFKTVQEIDNQIKKLDDAIASGDLKIVDERKNVKEISSLRKLRKDFGQIEGAQKQIDDDKAKIATLKKQLSALNNKEVQEKFETVTKELNEIRESTKSVSDKRKTINDQRAVLRKEKDSYYDEIRKINSEYQQALDKFKKDIAQENERIRKDEEDFIKAQEKSQREQELKEELALAAQPAFQREIADIKVLVKYFAKLSGQSVPEAIIKDDAASSGSITNQLSALNLNQTASRGRVVSAPEDYVVVKKQQEVFFQGNKNKNNKKGKKKNGASNKENTNGEEAVSSGKFILEPDVIVQVSELGLLVPTSREEVPKLIDELISKFEAFKKDQDDVTKKNIEEAKAKIAALEKKYAVADVKAAPKEDSKEPADAEAEA